MKLGKFWWVFMGPKFYSFRELRAVSYISNWTRHIFFFFSLFVPRKNVELKKVNSKYILKSTLTPKMKRKQTDLERCQSWPNVEGSHGGSTDNIQFYLHQVIIIYVYFFSVPVYSAQMFTKYDRISQLRTLLNEFSPPSLERKSNYSFNSTLYESFS